MNDASPLHFDEAAFLIVADESRPNEMSRQLLDSVSLCQVSPHDALCGCGDPCCAGAHDSGCLMGVEMARNTDTGIRRSVPHLDVVPVQVVDDSDDLHRSQASPQEVSAFDLIGLRMAHTALQEDYAQMRSDLRRVLLLSARALKPHCAKGPQWLGPNPEMQAFQSILEVLEMDPSHPALVG